MDTTTAFVLQISWECLYVCMIYGVDRCTENHYSRIFILIVGCVILLSILYITYRYKISYYFLITYITVFLFILHLPISILYLLFPKADLYDIERPLFPGSLKLEETLKYIYRMADSWYVHINVMCGFNQEISFWSTQPTKRRRWWMEDWLWVPTSIRKYVLYTWLAALPSFRTKLSAVSRLLQPNAKHTRP